MNYIKIDINGKEVGLKFGMASFRYLSDKLVDKKVFKDGQINEMGASYIIYSGYWNNCIVKEIDQELSLEDIVDWVEMNLTDEGFIKTLSEVLDLWQKNDFFKKVTEKPEEPKKKISRGKK